LVLQRQAELQSQHAAMARDPGGGRRRRRGRLPAAESTQERCCAEGQPDFSIDDPEEYRAQGFSPLGGAFVYATSSAVHLATRRE
jgi:hypothetical protein